MHGKGFHTVNPYPSPIFSMLKMGDNPVQTKDQCGLSGARRTGDPDKFTGFTVTLISDMAGCSEPA